MNFVEPTLDLSPACSDSQEFPVDILDRHELLDQLFELFETLSSSKASCSFALNGKWGSGKTFVIERLEHQLKQWQDGNKYLLFHYNCWQYDYYEEPLIAIVSAMLDDIAEHNHILSQGNIKKLQTAGQALKKLGMKLLEGKIGFDPNELFDQDEKSDFDTYRSFKEVIRKARKELAKLSNDQTLVIVVDELDRCLPHYAIKVLERLHHLFSGLQNTVLMLAIDKDQLNNVVKYTFGEVEDPSNYLKKFIDFEIPLDTGHVNNSFLEKYREYADLFDVEALEPWAEINDYLTALFSGIDIRTQEHIVKRIQTIHQLLFKDEKKDYAFMCFELFLAVLSTTKLKFDAKPLFHKLNGGIYNLCIHHDLPERLAIYIRSYWDYPVVPVIALHGGYIYFDGELSIPQIIIGYAEEIYGAENSVFSHFEAQKRFGEQIKDLSKVRRMLGFIK